MGWQLLTTCAATNADTPEQAAEIGRRGPTMNNAEYQRIAQAVGRAAAAAENAQQRSGVELVGRYLSDLFDWGDWGFNSRGFHAVINAIYERESARLTDRGNGPITLVGLPDVRDRRGARSGPHRRR